MEDKNVDSYIDKLMKIFKDFGDLLKEKNEIITNIMNENEKLRIEKSRLSSELQALTEMYNECKKENDDLKRKKEKSKTMCDECELQHKECHCDCAREFIPKDKMEGTKDKVEMVKLEITDMYNEYDMEVLAALTGILLHGLVL